MDFYEMYNLDEILKYINDNPTKSQFILERLADMTITRYEIETNYFTTLKYLTKLYEITKHLLENGAVATTDIIGNAVMSGYYGMIHAIFEDPRTTDKDKQDALDWECRRYAMVSYHQGFQFEHLTCLAYILADPATNPYPIYGSFENFKSRVRDVDFDKDYSEWVKYLYNDKDRYRKLRNNNVLEKILGIRFQLFKDKYDYIQQYNYYVDTSMVLLDLPTPLGSTVIENILSRAYEKSSLDFVETMNIIQSVEKSRRNIIKNQK